MSGQNPSDHLDEAEKVLVRLDPCQFNNDADIIAYAVALIQLANVRLSTNIVPPVGSKEFRVGGDPRSHR